MEIVKAHWHQIVFFIAFIVVAVRLESEVKSLRKDLDNLSKELIRRDTYVESVKHTTEISQMQKNITALWHFVNSLRDRFNGDK
jgi:uncharacterized protein YoxC|tara:strand:+ start:284 stop:535 length:252 start_codon:yes stop_codon:yes gene_type:complete